MYIFKTFKTFHKVYSHNFIQPNTKVIPKTTQEMYSYNSPQSVTSVITQLLTMCISTTPTKVHSHNFSQSFSQLPKKYIPINNTKSIITNSQASHRIRSHIFTQRIFLKHFIMFVLTVSQNLYSHNFTQSIFQNSVFKQLFKKLFLQLSCKCIPTTSHKVYFHNFLQSIFSRSHNLTKSVLSCFHTKLIQMTL